MFLRIDHSFCPLLLTGSPLQLNAADPQSFESLLAAQLEVRRTALDGYSLDKNGQFQFNFGGKPTKPENARSESSSHIHFS